MKAILRQRTAWLASDKSRPEVVAQWGAGRQETAFQRSVRLSFLILQTAKLYDDESQESSQDITGDNPEATISRVGAVVMVVAGAPSMACVGSVTRACWLR